MCTSDQNPAALSGIYRLFTVLRYLAIQIACFNAILECIANMIGRLLDFHIVESTPCNQVGKRRVFFDIRSDVHVTFYVFICFHLVV